MSGAAPSGPNHFPASEASKALETSTSDLRVAIMGSMKWAKLTLALLLLVSAGVFFCMKFARLSSIGLYPAEKPVRALALAAALLLTAAVVSFGLVRSALRTHFGDSSE